MIKDFLKYDLYRKYQTSDGVTYTPSDEYKCVLAKNTSSLECSDGNGIIVYGPFDTNNDSSFTLSNGGFFGEIYDLDLNLKMDYEDSRTTKNKEYRTFVLYPRYENMSFYNMFNGTSIHLYSFKPLWNTSGVIDMSNMFYSSSVKEADLSSFDTSNVTDMGYMFASTHNLTLLNVSSFNTSKVNDMAYMFSSTNLSSLDLSSFDTSNVTDMTYMFNGCTNLTSLDLSNFDTSKVTFMSYMFSSCNSLSYIKCKQKFKDWCISKQDTIKLPNAMREGGSGTWEIVE